MMNRLFTEFLSADKPGYQKHGHIIRVAMVGNPNSGKTTLFNFASRSREHVGNYTGVTVSSKTATFTLKIPLFILPICRELIPFQPILLKNCM